MAALHPELWFDNIDPNRDWRTCYGVMEDEDTITNLRIRNAPYSRPAPAYLPTAKTIRPLTRKEGLTVFTRVAAMGSVYRGGERDTSFTVDIEEYNKLYNSNDGPEIVDEYQESLSIGRQIMEVLTIIAGISTGTLIDNDVIKEFICRALHRGLLDTNSSVKLMKVFGIAPNGSDHLRAIDIRRVHSLHADPRVYALMYGQVTHEQQFRQMGMKNQDGYLS